MNDLPQKLKVAVHDGTFHADDVFAVAALTFLRPDLEVVRTRDPELLAASNIRIDVGDDYNPATKTYDHHMPWFNTRHKKPYKRKLPNGEWREYKEGPLRAGFGLIWLHYGTDIVKALIKEYYPNNEISDNLKEIDYVEIQQDIDNNLVARIDAIDNGEVEEFDINQEPFRSDDIPRLIAAYNPTTMETRELNQEQKNMLSLQKFWKAIDFAKNILISNVASRAELDFFREIFMQILGRKDPNDPILVLDQYIPWAYAYGRAGDATTGVEMVVYPAQNGTWMCQTPKYYEKRDAPIISPTYKDGSRRKEKHRAPENICGKRDEELEKITGIKDVTFVHKGGWLGAARTKEAAIALAEYIIQYGE